MIKKKLIFDFQYTAQHVTQLSWKCCQYLWLYSYWW